MTKLDRYWPRHDEINRCIKSQAETVAEAVLLAVHQACPIEIRNAGSSQEVPATENDLLDAFLTDNLPEGVLVLAITGLSGAGKSHMIRWLSAQLNRDPRAKSMHVIRIPKSASLRTVVDLITDPLADDPRYADARAELKRVTSEVTPEVGAVRFSGGLEIALRSLAERHLAELRENPRMANAKEIKARIDHAQKLPAFFGEAVLRNHFLSNVLARIVDRAIRGRDTKSDEDEALPQFAADDLKIPDSIDLGRASQSVRVYYQTVLSREGGKGFEDATTVLNDVVDDAISEVFQLRQALGGITLEEIILRIRDLLFEDGRELVLLIEDFAALTGIQETLLHVSIQEGVRDGKPIRATMRTAIALTDGYLSNRETILTRAKREWVIRTSLDTPDDVVERTTELIGGYLNAARWGEHTLEQKFKNSRNHPQIGLTEWVPIFDDETKSVDDAELLADFGKTLRGASLFPFNHAAIRSFTSRKLTVGDRLVFNPRRIIDFILREILLESYDEFERGVFPSAQFEGAMPTAEIADWLSRAVPNPDVRGRMASLLVHWGGNPRTVRELADLQQGLFRAFALPTPGDLGEVAPPVSPLPEKPKGSDKPKPQPPGPIQPEPREDAKLLDWREKLESWAAGIRLGHQDANLLRKEIVGALSKAVDWNALRRSPISIQQNIIQIPNTAGQNAPNAIAVAEDHSDPNGSIRRALLAFIRFYLNDHKWSYPLGDEDSAMIANLVDNLVPQFVSYLEANDSKDIGGLRDFLILQGRVVGIKSHAQSPDSHTELVFAKAPEINYGNILEQSPEGRWLELQEEVKTFRPAFQKYLVDRIGCFQGTGTAAYAIDIVRLASTTVVEIDKALTDLVDATQRKHVTDLQPNRVKARIQPIVKGLIAFAQTVHENLGDDFHIDTLLDGLQGLISDLEGAGIWPGPAFEKQLLLSNIDAFRSISLRDVLEQIKPLSLIETDKDLNSILDCVGPIDLSIVDRAREFIVSTAAFLKTVDKTVSSNEGVGRDVDPKQTASQIEQSLEAIDGDLKVLALEDAVA
jgi:hypothetical protein